MCVSFGVGWEWMVNFFFFSSRRRHTRYWRDWSSDVCSSDLPLAEGVPRALGEWREILDRPWPEIAALITDADEPAVRLRQSSPFAGVLTPGERRRVYEAFRA